MHHNATQRYERLVDAPSSKSGESMALVTVGPDASTDSSAAAAWADLDALDEDSSEPVQDVANEGAHRH